MRMKIIRRFAAGTIGVCFTYALVRMPFTMINEQKVNAGEGTSAQSVTGAVAQPTTFVPMTEYEKWETETTAAPFTTQAVQTPTQAVTEAFATEAITEEERAAESVIEEESVIEQENMGGGDVPTLEQFLQTLSCGGCRHNCLLISPRCMKGRAKAESATVEYYETYGA